MREAVTAVNADTSADTITFASGLAGQTLTLTQGELALTSDITIDGTPTEMTKRTSLFRATTPVGSSMFLVRQPMLISLR